VRQVASGDQLVDQSARGRDQSEVVGQGGQVRDTGRIGVARADSRDQRLQLRRRR
jgi:hypothetical protein